MPSESYEVMHDGPDGSLVKKKFTNLEQAKSYMQGKVCAGGPARLQVVEEAEEAPRRRGRPEPEPEPLRRRKTVSKKKTSKKKA